MQTINRWRSWKPALRNVSNAPMPEVPKVPKGVIQQATKAEAYSETYVTKVPEVTEVDVGASGISLLLASGNFSARHSAPIHDPEAWMEDFHAWAMSHCVFRDRCFGGIGPLHLHFSEWAGKDSVACTREVFEVLLRVNGFETADGLVYGLLLKEDACKEVLTR